ncbi:hypothetical protein ACFWUP_19510 [Nocardia sp. NPDC058658]|uniref:hypothetical protein n=1 Tax=Nocardia sp. NPDC058658 TaxID=3346580 RepID=UPI003649F6F6
MALARHCDRDGCDSWQRVDRDVNNRWITVDLGGGDIRHFDTRDCLMHWSAATSVPTEVYPAG